tara:strand:+ start:475 stop:630 length:156 start_codon:yes stop_codon:yes gene_type:complete
MMTKTEAQEIVIDVATKRRPHNRKALAEAVATLEQPAATPRKKKAASYGKD